MTTKTLNFKSPIHYKNFADASKDPGTDYYAYMCDKWIESNPLPKTEARWGSFTVLRVLSQTRIKKICDELLKTDDVSLNLIQKRVKNFYLSGLTVDQHSDQSLQVLQDEIKKIENITTQEDFYRYLGYAQTIGVSVPWYTVIDADDKDSSQYVLRIVQSGLTLPERDYYPRVNPDAEAKYYDGFKSHIIRIHRKLPFLTSDIRGFKRSILKLEDELANVSRTSVALRDVGANYNPYTIDGLASAFPGVSWDHYFSGLGWKPVGKIVVNQPEFVEFISKSSKSDLQMWKDYLKWQLSVSLLGAVSTDGAKTNFTFFGKLLAGQKTIKPLWRRVLQSADRNIGEDLGQLYVERYFPANSKKQVTVLVDGIKRAFEKRLQTLTWMEEASKQKALAKLRNIKLMIGYPDTWRSYNDVEIGNLYIKNVLSAYRSSMTYELLKPGSPVRRDLWIMTPQTVNAYCDFNLVSMVFPAAILQPPFFDSKASLAANYGGIGAVIGHELTHSFDDKGSEFDENGNHNPWLSEIEKKLFMASAQYIIDSANKHEVLPGLFMKGELVIGESIADLGGAEIAYQALMDQLKSQGLSTLAMDDAAKEFFAFNALSSCSTSSEALMREIALGDPHPDDKFRINGVFTHMDAYYKVFDVKKDSVMHTEPAKRARIW